MTNITTELEALKPSMKSIAARFDAASTDEERRGIAKEGVELMAGAIVRALIAKVMTQENLAAWAVQQIARHFAEPAKPTA